MKRPTRPLVLQKETILLMGVGGTTTVGQAVGTGAGEMVHSTGLTCGCTQI
jgi:hypothetical protein